MNHANASEVSRSLPGAGSQIEGLSVRGSGSRYAGWRKVLKGSNVPGRESSPIAAPGADAPIVFVVAGDAGKREALGALVRSAGRLPEMFASAQDFLARPRALVPSCLILDVTLPDLGGLELQERVAAERAYLPVIFVAGVSDASTIVKAMKGGAFDFLLTPLGDHATIATIERALEASRAAVGEERRMLSLRERYASLSRREQEVMALVVSGLLNKQVAFELCISEITVKAHRGRVMRKMGARSLAELVRMETSLDRG